MKAIEIVKCKECGEIKDIYTRGTSFRCACSGECESALVCGDCTEVEVKDENDLCPACSSGACEWAREVR